MPGPSSLRGKMTGSTGRGDVPERTEGADRKQGRREKKRQHAALRRGTACRSCAHLLPSRLLLSVAEFHRIGLTDPANDLSEVGTRGLLPPVGIHTRSRRCRNYRCIFHPIRNGPASAFPKEVHAIELTRWHSCFPDRTDETSPRQLPMTTGRPLCTFGAGRLGQ